MDKYSANLKKNGWLHFYQMDSIGQNHTFDSIITKAHGVYVYDVNNKKYLDAISGAYCVNVGYGRSNILQKAMQAAEQIHFVSPFSAANVPAIELSEKLSCLAEPVVGKNSRIFFLNSGSEAVDAAIKIARAYSSRTFNSKERYKIICRDSAYHGSTFGAMSCSGYGEEFAPLLPGICRIPSTNCQNCPLNLKFPSCNIACANDILNIIEREGVNSIAAVIIEPVETSTGIVPPPEGYLEQISKICKANNILLILDEVITGFGRLSHWFGAEKYRIYADIIICAKGLTSGYDSLAALIVKEDVASVFSGEEINMFEHGTTFGGRPAAAAAALENISIMENEKLFDNAEKMSKYLHKRLCDSIQGLSIVGNIRNAGLLFGVDLVDENNELLTDLDLIAKIRGRFIERGLLTSTFAGRHEPIIDLAPPLIITAQEVDAMVEILHDTLTEFSRLNVKEVVV